MTITSPDAERAKRRYDFLKAMYGVYWANMTRSMEGVWKVLTPITVAGSVIVAVHKQFLPGGLGISLAFVIMLWGINVTIDLNAWHQRNLYFAAKAEAEFLDPDDYGRLLPQGYDRPKRKRIEFYTMNLFAFLLFLLLTAVYGWYHLRPDERWLPVSVLVVGIFGTVINQRAQSRSEARHFHQLFGDTGNDPSDGSTARTPRGSVR